MPRQVYKYVKGRGLVPIEELERELYHSVIGDEMPDTVHPIDGKIYNSKSGFRNTTRRNNCVEVGNDLITKQKPKPRPEAVNTHKLNKFLWDTIDKAINERK